MKGILFLLITTFLLNYTFGFLFCPKTNKAPQKIDINSSYTINPIIYKNESYTAVKIGNKLFLNREISLETSIHSDSDLCPKGFKIPSKEDYESVINQLGKNAYSVFTDPNGFNMEPGTYYITNTKGNYLKSKIMICLRGSTIIFTDTAKASGKKVCRCMIDIYTLELNYTNIEGEININEKTVLTIESNYLNGYLWKIGDNIFTTKSIEHTFRNSGRHTIEFWGN